MNQRISAISPSLSLAITGKAKALAAAGENVCSFAAGEPDFDTPEFVKQAAAEALASGQTKYTPAAGLPALRKAISEKLKRDNALTYAPEQIIVSNGAKHSLFNVFMALLREGDEVVIPGPYWLSYPEMVLIAGGKAVHVPTQEANGFKITPEELEAVITPRSTAIVLNSPSNPTGMVYSADELRAVAEVAVKHDLTIISDEIYEKILYDGNTHTSVGSLSKEIFERTITVNGFSKANSMTGWRLGYVAAPEFIIKPMAALQSHSTSGPNTFAQHGALAALSPEADAATAEMVNAFTERRDYLLARIADINGISCVKPGGAFYALPNIGRLGLPAMEFSSRLLEEEKVAVIPGEAFGAPQNIRMSYACSMDNIKEGLDRIERFAGKL
ncbi:MAG: pyridoxal phosphate-dependent aminotransferase [Kiritimatiellae bacterium]|nr:pyridoxal phosphate-dependent aminotransferase [Kiritimatiellia bacterium]